MFAYNLTLRCQLVYNTATLWRLPNALIRHKQSTNNVRDALTGINGIAHLARQTVHSDYCQCDSFDMVEVLFCAHV